MLVRMLVEYIDVIFNLIGWLKVLLRSVGDLIYIYRERNEWINVMVDVV